MQRKDSRQTIKIKILSITVACTILSCSLQQEQQQQHTGGQEQGQGLKQDNDRTQTGSPTPVTGSLESKLLESGLTDISTLDSLILVELKYSTTDNFVGVDVYGDLTRCYLQPSVARMLVLAQKKLSERNPGLRLLLYDCVRPLSVQQILWDTLQKPEDLKPLYVADPKKGSIHNYGSAVDLTIADSEGKPLDMGTGYDFFGELAYPTKEEELLASGDLTEQQVNNRLLLREVMTSVGFTPIGSEWWHFNAHSRERAIELFEIVE